MITYLHKVRSRGRDFYYFRPPKFLRDQGMRQIRLPDDPVIAQKHAADLIKEAVTKEFFVSDSRDLTYEFRDLLLRGTSSARARAKSKLLPCDITADDVIEMLVRQEGRCAVSGRRFSQECPAGAFRKPYTPSLDRIDNRRGYELDNCRLVCSMVNYAMGEWGEEVFVELAYAVVNYRNKGLRARQELANKVDSSGKTMPKNARIEPFFEERDNS